MKRIILILLLCAGFGAMSETGYFTDEALATADMTGVATNIEWTLNESASRFAVAERLVRTRTGYAADQIATRLEIARRLRDYVAKRHRTGTKEMELLAWQGAEELKSFYSYFAAEARRETVRATLAPPVVLNVRDFGATGDGATDDGPAFRAALAAAQKAGGTEPTCTPVTIRVPAGVYLIKPENRPAPATFTSRIWRDYALDGRNTARAMTRPTDVYRDPTKFHLFVTQSANLTIQGDAGAELRFADATRGGIGFNCATETVVRNLTITYAGRAFTQGTVADIEKEPFALVVKTDADYPAPDEKRFLEARSRRITFHDANGLFRRNGTGRLGKVQPLGGGRFRLVLPDGMKTSRTWNEAQTGDRFTIIARYSESAMAYPIYFITSSFSGAENITVKDSPGQCFIFTQSFAMRLLNCRTVRRSDRDMLVSNADFMMCSGLIAPYVADCSTEYMEDDGMNFGTGTSVIKDVAPDRRSFLNTCGLDYASAFQVDGVTGRVKAFLRRGKTWDRLAGCAATNTITSKALPKLGDKEWLAANSWQGKKGEIKADRIVQIPGSSGGVVKNTTFYNHRGMGVQVHCANMLIDGMTCRHLTGPGACINPLFGWGMMFDVHNILVRNSVLDETGTGFVVQPGCVQPGIVLTHAQIHGVELTNNTYRVHAGYRNVAVGNADDVISEGKVLAPYGAAEGAKPLEVVAVYYPHWHAYPKGLEWFGPNWKEGEWAFVKTMKSRFPGHKVFKPLPGWLDGKDPEDVATEIDLAYGNGIDVFLYDYYWYAGAKTQEEAIEQGFLRAKNRGKMKFALMWCYHERVSSFRPAYVKERAPLMTLAHTPEEFLGLIDYSIAHYFNQPEYWRKDGKLFFSIYNFKYLWETWGKDDAKVRDALAEARRRVRTAGLGELHLNAQNVSASLAAKFAALGLDSLTDYGYNAWNAPNFQKRWAAGERLFGYEEIDGKLQRHWADMHAASPVPYIPVVPSGWDATARCRNDVAFPWQGSCWYPYCGTFTNTAPALFEKYLRDAKASAENAPKRPGAVYINAWNEYTEGCTILPNVREGDQMLRAVGRVFGRRPAGTLTGCAMRHWWDPKAKNEKAFTVPAPTYENLKYGSHMRQSMDVWLPKDAAAKRPVLINIHGGGWVDGDRLGGIKGLWARCEKEGVALVTISYRMIADAKDAGIKPPVKACLEDAVAAIEFVKAHADAWRLDVTRIGLTGGSAGACSSLYASLQGDCALGIRALQLGSPQTSLDPQEMKAWIPNSNYGAHAFGYPGFKEWLEHRADCLAEVTRYSPAGLLRRCTAAKAPVFLYTCPALPKPGELPKDPTHAAMFCVKFEEICRAKDVVCRRGGLAELLAELKR